MPGSDIFEATFYVRASSGIPRVPRSQDISWFVHKYSILGNCCTCLEMCTTDVDAFDKQVCFRICKLWNETNRVHIFMRLMGVSSLGKHQNVQRHKLVNYTGTTITNVQFR